MSETAEAPAPSNPTRRKRTAAIGSLVALGLAASAVFGVQTALGGTATAARAIAAPASDPAVVFGGRGGYGWGPGTLPGSGSTGSSTVAAATEATADQLVGVVDVTTVLGYENGEAAGTGMVLTSDGEVLTNNHVVEGATSITVTVLSTGVSYEATVVGTDPTDDVAVLQLSDASGLDTVQADDDAVAVGDAVTAVGNAGGAAGTSAAAGTVTALDQSITATDESGQDAEQLTGLIEIAADVEAGDSGGPLYDAEGEVVGMDTAASSTGGQAYAIPIATALSIAEQITSGVDDETVHQGYPAFLGVSVQSGATGGAAVAGVVAGGPADQAGLTAGDVVTAVGGSTVTAAEDVSAALAGLDPGDEVTVTWTDATGRSQTATVTLATGPAD
ncbi:S1C family serine protease [Modestobacter versicolor]|uniref:S1-C subfamily serine protease n=1 Tax=Modestobacter versicolor TaxID=429133 RepID=A0A839Y6Y0_9ACTN|nr:trypsin-like peptidase domain-containing protein [Modestobacter versicolor]MBB3676004.1 S1-C subfamily serine protease [Modestobacter versicolor]